MVPEGWVKSTTGASSRSYVPGRNKPKVFEGDIPWITTPEISGKYVPLAHHALFVGENAVREAGGKIVPKGCVIFSCVGDLGIVTQNTVPVVINQQLHAFEMNDDVCPDFFAYQLERAKPAMLALASTTTIPYLNKSNCEALPILLPPLPEQRKIADILSTWDRAIEKTESLLANARTQKRALMQSLLTGKRRFPGFEGQPWKEVRLGDVVQCLDNKRVPLNSGQRNEMQGDIPYWGANGIVGYVNDYVFDEPLVLLAEDGGYFDEFATRPIASLSYGKAWVNNHAHILRAGEQVQTEWLYYALVNRNILGFINSGTRSKLNKGDMLKIPLELPSLPEQSRIADAIGLADREVTDLEQQITKLRTEKKALMQQLLTGKRRVVV